MKPRDQQLRVTSRKTWNTAPNFPDGAYKFDRDRKLWQVQSSIWSTDPKEKRPSEMSKCKNR